MAPAPDSTHEIVILGTHHSGINIAHYLLRHTIPKLERLTPTMAYHVTIVGPNTKFFWNIAAPRFLTDDTAVPQRDVFLPIIDHFKSYDASKFAFIQGKATQVHADTKTVDITTSATELHVTFNTLVIATGATFASPLWQVNESEAVTLEAFATTRAALQKAKTVLIAGGGAVGVETAGEIGHTFRGVHTTLLSGAARLLPRLLASNSRAAENRLKKLRVTTEHNVRVKETKKNADGTTTAVLDNGTEKIVDVFIDATGGKPNTSFLPTAWQQGPRNSVLVSADTLRATFPGGAGIYAIGDVASYSDGSLITSNNSIAPLGTSIGIDIATANGKVYPDKQKLYKPFKDTQFVPTGPGGGVGQVLGWRLPSFLVWLVKSRTFFVSQAPGAVSGAGYVKA